MEVELMAMRQGIQYYAFSDFTVISNPIIPDLSVTTNFQNI